jgi:small subunit ribosomal protein S7
MPRRREVPKRDILPDPKFGNVEVSKFINAIMQSGKKSVAERIVYGAFDIITTKSGKDPLEVFTSAMGNVKPMVEVKSRRVGGANYQVPVEVRLAAEMLEASENRGGAVKKRDEVHRMAEANKAFAHFRF